MAKPLTPGHSGWGISRTPCTHQAAVSHFCARQRWKVHATVSPHYQAMFKLVCFHVWDERKPILAQLSWGCIHSTSQHGNANTMASFHSQGWARRHRAHQWQAMQKDPVPYPASRLSRGWRTSVGTTPWRSINYCLSLLCEACICVSYKPTKSLVLARDLAYRVCKHFSTEVIFILFF